MVYFFARGPRGLPRGLGDDFGVGPAGSGGTALAFTAASALAFAAAMPLACSISSITSSFIIFISPLTSLRIASALPGAGCGERFPRLDLGFPVPGEYSTVLGVFGFGPGEGVPWTVMGTGP